MQFKFVKFPNGLVWRVDENGWIEGSVVVPGYEGIDDLEARLDAIANAATGSVAGLTSFAYQHRAGDIVSFRGCAEEYNNADEEELEEYEVLHAGLALFKSSLAMQYGLTDIEVQRAVDSIGDDYGEECVLDMLGSQRQIRTPAHPAECDYVRIVVDGYEIAYWVADEWSEAPASVMGAIIGAAKGRS